MITIELDSVIWDADLVERDQWDLYGISQIERGPRRFALHPVALLASFCTGITGHTSW